MGNAISSLFGMRIDFRFWLCTHEFEQLQVPSWKVLAFHCDILHEHASWSAMGGWLSSSAIQFEWFLVLQFKQAFYTGCRMQLVLDFQDVHMSNQPSNVGGLDLHCFNSNIVIMIWHLFLECWLWRYWELILAKAECETYLALWLCSFFRMYACHSSISSFLWRHKKQWERQSYQLQMFIFEVWEICNDALLLEILDGVHTYSYFFENCWYLF